MEAEQRLREAISQAQLKREPGNQLARSLIAAGVFLQHGARLKEAGAHAAQALPMLDGAKLPPPSPPGEPYRHY